MMARFTDLRFTIYDLRLFWFAVALILFPLSVGVRADDLSTLLAAPKLPPYQWFASTDSNHRNDDYILLKPNETRRVPLAKGVLLRLWSTALEPDKIELALQNGVRVELLKGGKAKLGEYYQKAFTFYPDASTPGMARDLRDGAALVVTNLSNKENKWFYQVAVRLDTRSTLFAGTPAMSASPGHGLDLDNLYLTLKGPARLGAKLFALPANTKTPYQLCMASGSARSQKGKPIPILNVRGEGAFVGLILDIRPAPDTYRRTFAFLEGNETLVADGKKYEGTGTEDFFNSAWYFPALPFLHKYSGLTQRNPSPPSVTAYRWMIPDAVPFKKSFRFEFEHGNGNNDNDLEYRWVAFWYQKPPFRFEVPDELDKGASTPVADSHEEKSSATIPIFAALAGVLIVGGYVALRRMAWRKR
jgi:hypothetical protein